ncbi:MAG: hypothetical protein Q9224_006686, partial [Gallowayella concinna]
MASASFETISPEVQAQIMRNLDSIPALFSLLRASPRYYQVFRSRKEYLLTQLAFNHFHPQITEDVMELATVFRFPRPADRQTVQDYLNERDHHQLTQEQPSMALSTSIPLCKIGRTITWFLEDYRQNSLELLSKLGTDMELEQDPQVLNSDLSIIERGRLQRAFCRFETFCRLFVAQKGEDTSPTWDTYDNQARWFLEDGFLPDEIEEIACIRDFLVRRLWKTFDAIEEDAMESEISDQVRKLGEACTPKDWFSNQAKAHHVQYMEYLMAQGLEFLQQIFTSDGLKRA